MVFYINKQHGIFTVLFSFYVHFLTELFCPTDYNNVTTFWEKEELCEADHLYCCVAGSHYFY